MSRLDHCCQATRTLRFAIGNDVTDDDSELSRAFLNRLGELVSTIERAVREPELRARVLAWRPQSYHEFCTLSDTRDTVAARRTYAVVDPIGRRSFEAIVAAFDKLAADAGRIVARAPDDLAGELDAPLRTMRLLLDRAVTLLDDSDSSAAEAAGRRANRLYAR